MTSIFPAQRRKSMIFDIDDTLLDFTSPLLEFWKDRYGIVLTEKDIWCYDLSKVLGVSYEKTYEMLDEFYNTHYFDLIQPMPGAVDGLKLLKSHYGSGQRYYAVSARPSWLEKKTIETVTRFFPFMFSKDSIFLTNQANPNGSSMTKLSMCIKLDAGILYEDSLQHTVDAASPFTSVILLNFKRNDYPIENTNYVHRVGTFMQGAEKIIEIFPRGM